MIASSKISNYLIYAIGEILLVVIGILIALQINNWNEERKSAGKCREILLEIQENMHFNIARFEAEIIEEYHVINSIDIVLNNINEDKVYHDSLDFHFFNTAYWPTSSKKSSGYETLKSQGIDLVKSQALRESIVDIYEKVYNELEEIIRISEGNGSTSLVPLFTELFLVTPSIPQQAFRELGAHPIEYDKVLDSNKYRAVLTFSRHTRVVGIDTRMAAIEKSKALEQAISKALQKI